VRETGAHGAKTTFAARGDAIVPANTHDRRGSRWRLAGASRAASIRVASRTSRAASPPMTAQSGTGDGGDGVASRKETRAKDGDGRVVASAVGGDGGDEDIGRGSTTAIVAALAAVGLCIFPVNPPEALAGYGAPTASVSSPPLAQAQLEEVLNMDRRVALRRTSIFRISDMDLLLQELNALILLDQKALEDADVQIALQVAITLEENIKEAVNAYEPSSKQSVKSVTGLTSQRQRLLERRRLEAEFQKKLLQRKLNESRLNKQGQGMVYGSALAASCLSTAVMHPVDTVKVRKQALGAARASSAAAGAFVSEAAETSAVAVASVAAMAGVLAAEAEVVAAAEASGSFDSFDDVPAIIAPSASLSGTAPVVAEAATAATATAAIPTHQVAIADSAAWAGSDTGSWTGTGLGMGLTETMSATASSTGVAVRFTSASFDLDDNFDPASLKASYTLAETPGAAALGALALVAAEPEKIFAPLGVPLTSDGILSLYTGLLPNLVKEGPPLALYLGIYEALKALLLQTDLGEQPILCYLLAGGMGEVVGSVLRAPAEAIKSTQQSNEGMSIAEAMKRNFGDARGRGNIFNTWQVTVIRDVPFGAIQIALFEVLKISLSGMEHPYVDGDSFFGEAILGMIGGGVGAFVSAPADVVVTRMIKQQGGDEALSPAEMVKEIWSEGGVGAFFRGSRERVIYWAPAIGIFLTAYCQFRHLLLE